MKPPSSSAVGQASNSTCLCRNPTHVWIPNALPVALFFVRDVSSVALRHRNVFVTAAASRFLTQNQESVCWRLSVCHYAISTIIHELMVDKEREYRGRSVQAHSLCEWPADPTFSTLLILVLDLLVLFRHAIIFLIHQLMIEQLMEEDY